MNLYKPTNEIEQDLLNKLKRRGTAYAFDTIIIAITRTMILRRAYKLSLACNIIMLGLYWIK